MVAVSNRTKGSEAWDPEISQSVADYNEWYLAKAPMMWVEARERATADATEAMTVSDNFRAFDAATLADCPRALSVGRMAVSPTLARDRFVEFAGVSKNLVTRMERDNEFPARLRDRDAQLTRACRFLRPLFDPELFPWLREDRRPTSAERDRALLVLGERLAGAFYHPVLRNSQEARQRVVLVDYLRPQGFESSELPAFEMPPGTYSPTARNVAVVRSDGEPRNLPVDCVIVPRDDSLALVALEMKSAGDFTNVNKRRKEEADKKAALERTHGQNVVFLLQLFGYFDRGYLGFEAAAGIDWAWDHRLSDLAPYLGLPQS